MSLRHSLLIATSLSFVSLLGFATAANAYSFTVTDFQSVSGNSRGGGVSPNGTMTGSTQGVSITPIAQAFSSLYALTNPAASGTVLSSPPDYVTGTPGSTFGNGVNDSGVVVGNLFGYNSSTPYGALIAPNRAFYWVPSTSTSAKLPNGFMTSKMHSNSAHAVTSNTWIVGITQVTELTLPNANGYRERLARGWINDITHGVAELLPWNNSTMYGDLRNTRAYDASEHIETNPVMVVGSTELVAKYVGSGDARAPFLMNKFAICQGTPTPPDDKAAIWPVALSGSAWPSLYPVAYLQSITNLSVGDTYLTSVAYGVNPAGTKVVGYAQITNGTYTTTNAFYWTPNPTGTPVTSGAILPSGSNITAVDVNDSGVIVGNGTSGGAFLWPSPTSSPVSITSSLSGWSVASVQEINNNNQISVTLVNTSGETKAARILYTP